MIYYILYIIYYILYIINKNISERRFRLSPRRWLCWVAISGLALPWVGLSWLGPAFGLPWRPHTASKAYRKALHGVPEAFLALPGVPFGSSRCPFWHHQACPKAPKASSKAFLKILKKT